MSFNIILSLIALIIVIILLFLGQCHTAGRLAGALDAAAKFRDRLNEITSRLVECEKYLAARGADISTLKEVTKVLSDPKTGAPGLEWETHTLKVRSNARMKNYRRLHIIEIKE